jgi:hypothetical protein
MGYKQITQATVLLGHEAGLLSGGLALLVVGL